MWLVAWRRATQGAAAECLKGSNLAEDRRLQVGMPQQILRLNRCNQNRTAAKPTGFPIRAAAARRGSQWGWTAPGTWPNQPSRRGLRDYLECNQGLQAPAVSRRDGSEWVEKFAEKPGSPRLRRPAMAGRPGGNRAWCAGSVHDPASSELFRHFLAQQQPKRGRLGHNPGWVQGRPCLRLQRCQSFQVGAEAIGSSC